MNVQTVVTIFNRKLGDDRRELYYPTRIASASYLEAKRVTHSSGVLSDGPAYKLRIPFDADQDGKSYLSAAAYKALDADEAKNHWTLQAGDVVLTTDTRTEDPVDASALEAIVRDSLADRIQITEYADNTLRGSSQVKHWRIGGE